MKVSEKRFAEVIIRKLGNKPNVFDKQKSFSIEQTEISYTIEEYKKLLEVTTNLSKKLSFKELTQKLSKI